MTRKTEDVDKKYILYGAGDWGIRMLHVLGTEKVMAFVDANKAGTSICGKPVISPEQLINYKDLYQVILSVYDADALDAIERKLWDMNMQFILAENYVSDIELDKLSDLPAEQQKFPETKYMLQIRQALMLPYPSCQGYMPNEVQGGFDTYVGLNYCWHNGRKLYMPSRYGRRQCQKIMSILQAEQDPQSPHRYFDCMHRFSMEEVFIDVGAAEGMISLDLVDKATEVVLYEGDEMWAAPLYATFAPWQDKVSLITECVGASSRVGWTTLDERFANDSRPIFIKVDIEGEEEEFLQGAKLTLTHGNVRMSICCYHDENRPEQMRQFLENLGYKTRYSQGWVYLHGQFRKGVIYAEKAKE